MDLREEIQEVRDYRPARTYGTVQRVKGLLIEARTPRVFIGEICFVESDSPAAGNGAPERIPCEVVGVDRGTTFLMPFEYVDSVSVGSRVETTGDPFSVQVGEELLGRVLNGLGEPVDGEGQITTEHTAPVNRDPPRPLERPRITEVLGSGVRVIDALLTWGKGQRLGVFSGSGVGKSTLLGMMARNSDADVNVIALIGERGREVREFIETNLGEEGLERSVVVTVTSDESPIMRIKGTLVAHTIAEHFRERGEDVLLMMDSLTRYAYALREIGLALGEPPTTRGYTPSVYARIPQLCERAGLTENGSITAVYSVLVEGDDLHDPVGDIARSVLDGHIALSRRLSSEGFYPPVDSLESISRLMNEIVEEEHRLAAQWARNVIATYREAEDLINIGAYQRGNNPKLDHAVDNIDRLNNFLQQHYAEQVSFDEALDDFLAIWRDARQQQGFPGQ